MSGTTDLRSLIREMRPVLQPGTYVFCSWAGDAPPAFPVLGTFREADGLTLIVEEATAAAHALPCLFQADWIMVEVHSSLEAVGFLAELTRALAAAGIACNVVSAARHDHLFVPAGRGAEAVAALERLQQAEM